MLEAAFRYKSFALASSECINKQKASKAKRGTNQAKLTVRLLCHVSVNVSLRHIKIRPLSQRRGECAGFTWFKLSLVFPISLLPRLTQLWQLLNTTSWDKSDIYKLHELYQIPPRARSNMLIILLFALSLSVCKWECAAYSGTFGRCVDWEISQTVCTGLMDRKHK